MRFGRFLFLVIAIMLLAPWPVAYAYDISGHAGERVDITPVETAGWEVFGGAIGSIKAPIDLFYIDSKDSSDNHFSLYLTNAGALSHAYRYLILKLGIYIQDGSGGWARVNQAGISPDIFITLLNGQAGFTLPGPAKYRISIDGGSFFCSQAIGENDRFSPRFYLEIN